MASRERTELEIAVIDGATRALNSIAKSAEAGKTTFTELSSAIGLVEKAIGFIGAAGAGIANAVKPAADFQDALALLQAQGGATAEELAGLKKAAEDAVGNTRFSALEAADALRLMGEDGVNATDSMQQLGTVLAFAQANALSAAEAALGLGGVLDGFGEAAGNIGPLADALSAVSREAGTSTKALQEGLAGVGLQATDAGVSMEIATAALGVFATAGQDGTKAAGQLGKLLTELNDPAKNAGKALADLGLSTNDFGGLVRTLREDSGAAATVLESLSARTRISLGVLLREGGASLDGMIAKYRDSAGAAQEAADIVGSTFNAAVDKLGNAIETAKASLLEPILAPLATEIDALGIKIKAFAETQDFAILQAEIGKFVSTAITELKRLGEDFDATKAVAAIKDFATQANEALKSLKETVDAVKTGFNAIGFAFNAVQTGAAAVTAGIAASASAMQDLANKTGIAGAEGERWKEAFDSVRDTALESAAANDKQSQSYLDALFPAEAATNATRGVAAGNLEAANSTLANASANDQLAIVLPEVTELSDGLKNTLDASSDASKNLAKNVGTGLNQALSTSGNRADELRAKIANLNTQLAKAFAEGADTKPLIAQLNAAEKELQALTNSAKKASDSTADLGDKAIQAAPKIETLSDSTRKASDSVKEFVDSNNSGAESLVSLTGFAQEAATSIEGISQKFLDLQAAQLQAQEGIGAFNRDALGAALDAQRQQFEQALKLADDVDAELQKKLASLRARFDLLGDDVLRSLAEKEIAAEKRKKTEAGNKPETSVIGAAAPGGININLSLSALDPASLSQSTLKDFARQLAAPIRTFIQSGA